MFVSKPTSSTRLVPPLLLLLLLNLHFRPVSVSAGNGIGADGAASLSLWLSTNTTLRSLTLWGIRSSRLRLDDRHTHTHTAGKRVRVRPPEKKTSTRPETRLDLTENQLGVGGAAAIGWAVSINTSHTTLDLGSMWWTSHS